LEGRVGVRGAGEKQLLDTKLHKLLSYDLKTHYIYMRREPARPELLAARRVQNYAPDAGIYAWIYATDRWWRLVRGRRVHCRPPTEF
jgi:hypothetical protein